MNIYNNHYLYIRSTDSDYTADMTGNLYSATGAVNTGNIADYNYTAGVADTVNTDMNYIEDSDNTVDMNSYTAENAAVDMNYTDYNYNMNSFHLASVQDFYENQDQS